MDDKVKNTLRQLDLSRQTIISGPVSASLKLAKTKSAISWPDVAKGKTYAIRLRRDRILVINGPQLDEGWNQKNSLAISDMSGAFTVFELAGPGALKILNMGTEIDPATPSGSAMRNFHGFELIIYPHQTKTTYRLHIPRAHASSLFKLLTGFLDNQ